MESICTTGTNCSNIPSVKAFANVYNRAFPLKIEEEYVKLVNLIYEYVEICRFLGLDNTYQSVVCIGLPSLYKELESINDFSNNYLRLLKKLVEGLPDNLTPEQYDKISTIVFEAKKVAWDKQGVEDEIRGILNNNFETEQRLAKESEKLSVVVSKIQSQLGIICGLDITSGKRLDTLQIKPEHFLAIDNLDISSKEKEVLKRELVSYFNMRRSAFKLLEEFGYQIIDSYRKRIILDHNAANINAYNTVDSNFEIYRIALEILSVYSCNRRLGTIYQSSCEEISNECNILDLLSSAFINREYNKEDFENALNTYRFSGIDTNLVDVLNHLIYSVSDYTESHSRH